MNALVILVSVEYCLERHGVELRIVGTFNIQRCEIVVMHVEIIW
jgi:hypothetical protein